MEPNVSCIFVVKGREAFRKEMPFPGMEEFVVEWEESVSNRITRKDEIVKRKGRFYWHSMDARRNQVFVMCDGYTGEIL